MDAVTADTSATTRRNWAPLASQRKADAERVRRKKRREWMMRMYRKGGDAESADGDAGAESRRVESVPKMLDSDEEGEMGDDLVQWAEVTAELDLTR